MAYPAIKISFFYRDLSKKSYFYIDSEAFLISFGRLLLERLLVFLLFSVLFLVLLSVSFKV
jgi:hypothetical protein